MSSKLATSALLICLIASCAGPSLDVNEVLKADSATLEVARSDFPTPAHFDKLAAHAKSVAAPESASVPTLVNASRALFRAADARVQRASLDRLMALESAQLADVIDVEDELPDQVHAEVETLTREALAFAERALALDPTDVEARLYRAINTALLAWSVGNSRALFEGLGSDCKRAIGACLEQSEATEGAAPLRLRGRFLSKAPWPLGDQGEAVTILRRATELAPVNLNWLFLGDALHAHGDQLEAHQAWQRATSAKSDPGSAALDAYHREFARRRLALAE